VEAVEAAAGVEEAAVVEAEEAEEEAAEAEAEEAEAVVVEEEAAEEAEEVEAGLVVEAVAEVVVAEEEAELRPSGSMPKPRCRNRLRSRPSRSRGTVSRRRACSGGRRRGARREWNRSGPDGSAAT
jgi:IS5 family transposase